MHGSAVSIFFFSWQFIELPFLSSFIYTARSRKLTHATARTPVRTVEYEREREDSVSGSSNEFRTSLTRVFGCIGRAIETTRDVPRQRCARAKENSRRTRLARTNEPLHIVAGIVVFATQAVLPHRPTSVCYWPRVTLPSPRQLYRRTSSRIYTVIPCANRSKTKWTFIYSTYDLSRRSIHSDRLRRGDAQGALSPLIRRINTIFFFSSLYFYRKSKVKKIRVFSRLWHTNQTIIPSGIAITIYNFRIFFKL